MYNRIDTASKIALGLETAPPPPEPTFYITIHYEVCFILEICGGEAEDGPKECKIVILIKETQRRQYEGHTTPLEAIPFISQYIMICFILQI